jgi:hypothetical protein
LRIVRQQVQVMQKRGKSGVEAWTKVALALEHMRASTEAKPAEVQPYTRASRSGRAVRNRRKA